MSFSWQETRLFIELNPIATLAIAMMLYFLGRKICRYFPILDRYCIPAAIVGGTTFAFINLLNHQFLFASLTFDVSLQTPAMAGFFACAGLNSIRSEMKRGAKGIGLYFTFCVFLVFMQNVLAMGLGALFGIGPALGLMAGSTSMVGGHGTAISFSAELVESGIRNAAQVGISAATFGLVSGSAIGGPLASYLIKRDNIITPGNRAVSSRSQEGTTTKKASSLAEVTIALSQGIFFRHITLVLVVMGFSSLFASLLSYLIPGIAIPASVAAMLLGMVFGLGIKHTKWFTFDAPTMDLISELMLVIFLTESSMSLQLWQLFSLALPLVTILVLQVALILILARYLVYPAMAKALENRYDAAVIVAGLCGHGLGATPNAIANMDAVCDQFGPSPTAYLIIPLAGGFLIDLVNIPLLLLLLNLLT